MADTAPTTTAPAASATAAGTSQTSAQATPETVAAAEPSAAAVAAFFDEEASDAATPDASAETSPPDAPAGKDDDDDDDTPPDAGDEPTPGDEQEEETPKEDEEEDPAADEPLAVDFELPAWAADLPDEAKQQLTEMGAGLVQSVRKAKDDAKAAKAEAAAAKTEADAIKAKANAVLQAPAALTPTPDRPLAAIRTEADLDAHLAEAQRTIAWCEENEDGAELDDGKGGTREYTAKDIRAIRRNAEKAVQAAPQRREYLQLQAKADTLARKVYPQLFVDGSNTHKNAAEILADVPELVNAWDHKLLLGDMLIGRAVRNGTHILVKKSDPAAKKAAATKAAAKPAPKPPAPLSAAAAAPAAKPAGSADDIGALRAAANQGNPDAQKKLVESFFGE